MGYIVFENVIFLVGLLNKFQDRIWSKRLLLPQNQVFRKYLSRF